MFLINETLVSGSITARVKNYYSANNFLVVMDVRGGNLTGGMTVTGTCSGYSQVLPDNFEISDFADLNYDDLEWEDKFLYMITTDEGNIIVDDSYQFANTIACDEEVKNLQLNNAIYLDTGVVSDEDVEPPEDEELAEDDI